MKFDEWLNSIPIRQTPKGARLDLRLYVYPDGHGNFYIEDDQGKLFSHSQPVNDPDEARDVIERIWTRAMDVNLGSAAPTSTSSLADQFADVIGIASDLTEDLADRHDHYVHGAAKR